MRIRSPWFAMPMLLALTVPVVSGRAYAQPYRSQIEVLIPAADGVLWLDSGEISRAYLRSLERRRPRKSMRAERRRYAQQETPRPPDDIGRSETPRADPPRIAPPRLDEARDKLRDEVQRLSTDTARMRSETDALRESVSKLTGETSGLRGEVGALRDELAKRAVEPIVTGKLPEPPRPSEPLRKQDSLKTDTPKSGADEKFAERPATDSNGVRKQDERFTDTIARAWRRVREMIGRPGQ